MAKEPVFYETTSFQQYRSAIDFLQIHIQLLDASLIQTSKALQEYTDQEVDINIVLGLDIQSYDKLNHPAKQQTALVNHSQKKNIEFAIVRLYNLFTTYLHSITKEMYVKNPMLVVGKAVINKNGNDKENLSMSYAEIVRLENYNNIQEQIVLKIFRSFEELRSTRKLLDKILENTKVKVPKTVINDALAYLELRHLYVHNQGCVDSKYVKEYGEKFTPKLKEKKEIPSNIETFTKALKAINDLIEEIDKQLIEAKILEKRKYKKK